MKRIALMAALSLTAVSCYDDGTDICETATRISISSEIEQFNADGTTASGNESFTAAVVVNAGTAKSDMEWKAEVVDAAAWATVSRISVVSQYTQISGSEIYTVKEPGIEVAAQPNTEYRRSFAVKITAADGTAEIYEFTQLGLKADAEVTSTAKTIDFPAAGDAIEVTYTTNMGDLYAYDIVYDGASKDWLTATHEGEGRLMLTAEAWTSQSENRTATLTITVGSPATSMASLEIPVTQLRSDTYYYMYGGSVGETRENAVSMTKVSEGIYTVQGFFFETEGNVVCFNKNTRSESYPVYYLAAGGSVATSSEAVAASDLDIEANGVRTLTVDFNEMTWSWERKNTVGTSMPNSELALYPTKAYITQSGTFKTWMTVSLHWNGGDKVGQIKLGSGLVGSSKTGGYGTPTDKTVPYDVRNSAYDTVENGGLIEELMDDDGQTLASKYGRLYSTYEMITGQPNGALNNAYQIPSPYGEPGATLVDATGETYTVESILTGALLNYDASPAGDAQAEADHPNLKMQIQGICPYGWHIANMQDWKDLIYAASEASQGSEYEVAVSAASYKALAGGTIANFASILYDQSWNKYTTDTKISSRAEAFGFNMFIQGWRLYASGYDYGTTSGNPRFYEVIPVLGQYNSKKTAFWRIYVTNKGTNMTVNDAFDLGNGSGSAVRCVKNYK